MPYVWDFGFLDQYGFLLWRGAVVTVLYTLGTIAAGLLIGLAAGLARMARVWPIRWLSACYIEIFRCTPLLVQIIWFYYALPIVAGIEIGAYVAATLSLSLYGGAFFAEIFRGGVRSIEKGQWDGGFALGMTRAQAMRRVILPQAVKRMVPPFMNQCVLQLKNTSLVSTIAVADLLYQGTIVTAATYRPLEVYTLIAVIYFAILWPMTLWAQLLEARLARSD
jgi:polar amino acid transport system permease protein